jgi:hypothetical protein
MEARSMGSGNHQTIETRYTIKAMTILCKLPGTTSTMGYKFALHSLSSRDVCIAKIAIDDLAREANSWRSSR